MGSAPHTASLGLVFYRGDTYPASYRGGAFVNQHGSRNRQPLNGYRVVFIPFPKGRPRRRSYSYPAFSTPKARSRAGRWGR